MIAKGRRFQFRGSDSGRAILDESKVDEIRVLIASGLPYKLIAPRFGISVQTISAINTGVAWKHHVSPTRSSQPAS
jgi:DNA invertase Pin-like site-specific DNA recombinase